MYPITHEIDNKKWWNTEPGAGKGGDDGLIQKFQNLKLSK